MKKIVYGVCGIGNGHAYRQLPIINHLAQKHKIMIFAYGRSLGLLSARFRGQANVRIAEVAVPFFPGGTSGLDFAAAAELAAASNINHVRVNCRALTDAVEYLGQPDLVISDYEPVSAQLAYAYGAPLVTIDQQSKYLRQSFPALLHDQTYIDEVMRLRMFFPTAAARLACSFFKIDRQSSGRQVQIFPPVLRPELATIKRVGLQPSDDLIVYQSAQKNTRQSLDMILAVLSTQPKFRFHVFVDRLAFESSRTVPDNTKIYPYGHKHFEALLASCCGVITTAGHTLLSEAMHLGLPVLAMPLDLYEQQMNAYVIDTNQFGLAATKLDSKILKRFIGNLGRFSDNIQSDTSVLLRGDGARRIIRYLNQKYLD